MSRTHIVTDMPYMHVVTEMPHVVCTDSCAFSVRQLCAGWTVQRADGQVYNAVRASCGDVCQGYGYGGNTLLVLIQDFRCGISAWWSKEVALTRQ